ncbi:MAG: hypothetical protein V4660_14755 [Pseudomonadota bacterium]
MTSVREKDYVHPNERGNGPKARMEGGDETDDISINDPDTRSKELRRIKASKNKTNKSITADTQPIPPQK